MIKLRIVTAAVSFVGMISCGEMRPETHPSPPSASEVARKLPPAKIPVPVSPVDLRTAVMTLPADAQAEMSLDGRRNYLASRLSSTASACGFDEANRRLEFFSDNPYTGIDAQSMFFLRLFEDEQGRTIAASHSARPFADGSQPSARFTRVYRLENRKWRDITATALSPGIPEGAFFRFDQLGAKVEMGPYVEERAVGGRGSVYTFGKVTGTIRWRNGAFRKD